MGSEAAPSPSAGPVTHALSSQVAGHANAVLTTEDDTLLIKQALPLELQFYQTVAAAAEPELDALRPFIPKFIGTLSLEGEFDADAPTNETSIAFKPLAGPRKDSLVLENLAHPFLRPNILDVKLGTVLYDESAPPDKIARMRKAAEATTSGSTGMRYSGFQVYDNTTGTAVHTSKAYKSISAAQLPEGLARFFPIASAAPGVSTGTEPPLNQGLPSALLHPILELLREDIADIRDALSALELRLVGASLLILYESDPVRAEEGVKWMLDDERSSSSHSSLDDDDSDSDDEGDVADGKPKKPRKPTPPCDVRLIDFAHTRFVPGQGPDEGVLLGLDTFLRLMDERIEVVARCL
ncbi:hypothetical protein C8F04DRAFT_1140343 [Mycena alexandri]|uniref:Kinase n=1 Tax=Mycena alexandri TaxID=1745969 RepID=A0AAD6S5J0_9AGAR|nr:hypothetical protein C8F04DRAFT_1140343 [Mycena alexandri]